MPRSRFPYAVHPGEILAEELKELGVSARELARQLAVPSSRISRILQGERPITGDTALRLGRWFGMDPQIWLNLQTAYEIDVAVEKAGAEIRKLPTRSAAA